MTTDRGTTENALAEAFATLEDQAPDADAEFAALSARLAGVGRRRMRRPLVGGLVAGGLAAAVAAGVTVGVTHATSHGTAPRAIRSSAAPQHSDAPPLPAVRQVAFSEQLTTTTGADGITRPAIEVHAGWLPTRATLEQAGADTMAGGESYTSWTVPYAGGDDSYQISAQIGTGSTLPRHTPLFGRADDIGLKVAGRDLTVRGRPARLFASRGNLMIRLFILQGHGRLAEVSVFRDPSEMTTSAAVAVVEHVARETSFDRPTALRVTARLTAAPRGATIVDAYAVFDRGSPMTSYRLDDETHGAQIGIGGLAEKYPAPIEGRAGRDVQGHRSVVIHSQGRVILYIARLFGRYTKLISGRGAETLKDLYRIADGIRAVR